MMSMVDFPNSRSRRGRKEGSETVVDEYGNSLSPSLSPLPSHPPSLPPSLSPSPLSRPVLVHFPLLLLLPFVCTTGLDQGGWRHR